VPPPEQPGDDGADALAPFLADALADRHP